MAPPKKYHSGQKRSASGGPPKAQHTVAQRVAERSSRSPRGSAEPDDDRSRDPERANETIIRANPKTSSRLHDNDAVRHDDGFEPDEDISGSFDLQGDGLDALDPEIDSAPEPNADDAGDPSDERESESDREANATRAGPPIRLEIVAGPDKGKKRWFKGVRMVVGRTPGVDLLLSDQSVSRRHFELIYGDKGIVVRDLGSGNGTKVNGDRITERLLVHGDEISLGKTRIRIVDELAALHKARDEASVAAASADEGNDSERPIESSDEIEQEAEPSAIVRVDEAGSVLARIESPRPAGIGKRARAARYLRERVMASRQTKIRAAIGAFAVLILAIVLGALLLKPSPPTVDAKAVAAAEKMQAARGAIRDDDFDRAVALIDEAEQLVPDIDKTHIGSQARSELAFRKTLASARAAMDGKRFDEARRALATATNGSVKSEQLKAQLLAQLEEAEIAAKIARVDEYVKQGDIENARATLATLPVEAQAASAKKIDALAFQIDQQKKKDALAAKRAAVVGAAAKKERREEEIAAAFSVVERKFAGGEWDRAASECLRVIDANADDREIVKRATELRSQIPNFGRNFDEGMKKFKQGVLAQAAKPLRVANQLYGQMNLLANKFGQEIQEKLVQASVAAGREALLRDDLVNAAASFRDAYRLAPDEIRARQGLDQVEEKANDFFARAYSLKDVDRLEAIRQMKIVIRSTEPGAAIHERAKNQLAGMEDR